MLDRTKDCIINAFNNLIKYNEFEKISVEMIIKEAKISKATFYRYFKDKYDVMNTNYKILLDDYSRKSTNYKDLYEGLYKYGIKNWKFMQRAFDTTGCNSFCEYIGKYSYQMVEQVTRQNRNGKGLSEEEKLQLDVYCIGISYMYKNWIQEKYALSPSEAANALYDLMPSSLKNYWWLY